MIGNIDHLESLIQWAESQKRYIEARNPERSAQKQWQLEMLDLFIWRVVHELEVESEAD